MQQMVDLRKQWDPNGGRVMGTRDNDAADANKALTPVSEYYGVMIGQDRQTDQVTQPGQIFRGYSVERRDKAPLIETEDFRDEAARGIWDDYSPPHFGFKPKGGTVSATRRRSGHLSLELRNFLPRRRDALHLICGTTALTIPIPAHSKWSGLLLPFTSRTPTPMAARMAAKSCA